MVYVCQYVKSKLITCKHASTSNNASWEKASFPCQHISSPLYYCNTSELTWCGLYLCGLWWAVHLLITGLTLCCISATYKEKTFNAGYVLLDVSSMKLWTHFPPLVLFRVDVVGAYVALLGSSLLEKALNVTVVILYLILNWLPLPGSQLKYGFIVRKLYFFFSLVHLYCWIIGQC